MNRQRLAAWAVVAALGLVSGCRSCHNPCNGNGGLLSRLSNRNGGVCCEGPVCGCPVSSMGVSLGNGCCNGCCDGGPMLADPTMINGGMMPPLNGIPSSVGPGMGFPPTTTIPPMTSVPSVTTIPPGTMLPSPVPVPGPGPIPSTGPPPLAPVPGPAGPMQATPTPAAPSSSRWWR